MSFTKPTTIFVVICVALYAEQTIHVAAIGTLSLHSSLERSNREFACPQESVALTCSVNGSILEWAQPNDNTIGSFNQNGSVGDGFSQSAINCDRGAGTARASGVLEVINRDSNFSICNSTMILTPSPDCVSLSVICKSDNGSAPTKSTRFQVAAVPLAPTDEQIMCNCTCDKYQQACTTLLKVKISKADVIAQNQDTSDIDLITMSVLGADVQPLSISPNTDTESDFITANFTFTDHECAGGKQFDVNVTIIDTCSQQSSPVVIECKPCELKDPCKSSVSPLNQGCRSYWIQVSVSLFAILLLIA